MRVIDQKVMNQLFEVTDELEIDREAFEVPLLMEGEGRIRRTKKGKIEITLPNTDDLGPFLAALPERLRALS